MKLWQIKLTDPKLPRRRQRQVTLYVAMSEDQDGALALVRSDHPLAFAYQPEIEVTECNRTSLCMRSTFQP